MKVLSSVPLVLCASLVNCVCVFVNCFCGICMVSDVLKSSPSKRLVMYPIFSCQALQVGEGYEIMYRKDAWEAGTQSTKMSKVRGWGVVLALEKNELLNSYVDSRCVVYYLVCCWVR